MKVDRPLEVDGGYYRHTMFQETAQDYSSSQQDGYASIAS